MTLFRNQFVVRCMALVALVGLLPALVGPALAARSDDSAALYAEWVRHRLDAPELPAIAAALDAAAERRATSLGEYASHVVDRLVADQGVEWTALHLLGTEARSAGEIVVRFVEGLRSLSPSPLPPVAELTSQEAPRALPLRLAKSAADQGTRSRQPSRSGVSRQATDDRRSDPIDPRREPSKPQGP